MGGAGDERNEAKEIRRLTRTIICSGADTFADQAVRARAAQAAVLAESAELLTQSLNSAINTMPQDTLEEKRKLSAWVNHELRQLGLAIKCPSTGRPAILTAEAGRRDEDEGSRFRIESRDDRGRKVRAPSSEWVPELALIADAPRVEGRARQRE